MHTHQKNSAGFTLIELLVVVGVITLLISITLPGFMIAKERGRRVLCLANIHQFILGLQVYADQNNNYLPTAGISSTFEMLPSYYDVIAESVGSSKVLSCPSLGEPFSRKTSYNDLCYMGYNYLGGHTTTPWALVGQATREWESAKRTTGRYCQ